MVKTHTKFARRTGLLAGLEAGTAPSCRSSSLLGWLALASTWYRRSDPLDWPPANIMATTFYGEAALGRGFTFRTVAGLALYLVLYGIIGALFGLTLASRDASLRITLIGVLVGLGWYYLSFAILWRNINPLILLYTQSGPCMLGQCTLRGDAGHLLSPIPRGLE